MVDKPSPSLKKDFQQNVVSGNEEGLLTDIAPNFPNLKFAKDTNLPLIKSLISQLEKSERGRELLACAEKNNTWIGFGNGVMRSQGSYCEKQNRILLNPSIKPDKMVVTFAHELRHAEQFNTTINLNPEKDSVKTYLMGMFAIEADANANSALVAWELKEQGNEKPLNAFLEESPNIVEPFIKEANNGKMSSALDAAFNGWYDNIYIRRAYEANYSGMLRQNYVQHSKDPEALSRIVTAEETIKRTCSYKNSSYFKDKPEKLEDKDHLSLGHDVWWNCWRTYRSLAVRKDWNTADDTAHKNMKDIPTRNPRDPVYYDISPKEAKKIVQANLLKQKHSR